MQLLRVERNDVQIEITQLGPEKWSIFSEDAHRACFSELRPAYTDRIDYALLAHDPHDRGVLGYVTVRELDSESVYWQYGGAFQTIEKRSYVFTVYLKFVETMRGKYKSRL